MCLEEAMLNLKRRVAKRRAAIAIKGCPCPFGCIPVIKGDGPAGVNKILADYLYTSSALSVRTSYGAKGKPALIYWPGEVMRL